VPWFPAALATAAAFVRVITTADICGNASPGRHQPKHVQAHTLDVTPETERRTVFALLSVAVAVCITRVTMIGLLHTTAIAQCLQPQPYLGNELQRHDADHTGGGQHGGDGLAQLVGLGLQDGEVVPLFVCGETVTTKTDVRNHNDSSEHTKRQLTKTMFPHSVCKRAAAQISPYCEQTASHIATTHHHYREQTHSQPTCKVNISSSPAHSPCSSTGPHSDRNDVKLSMRPL
jgi:hypothetical protein